MNELLYKGEMLWMQRSRINWLKEGEKTLKKFTKRQFGELGKIK
jgi:hypothetical protein